MPLVALMTEAGPSYVDLSTVCLISAPFASKGHHPSRTVGLVGGHKVYCLDSEFNRQALISLLPDDAPRFAQMTPLPSTVDNPALRAAFGRMAERRVKATPTPRVRKQKPAAG